MKTIDINTYKWFDKTYGNTYFAQEIIIDLGLDSEVMEINPIRYGYGSFDMHAFTFLRKKGYQINSDEIIVRNHEQYAKKSVLNNLK